MTKLIHIKEIRDFNRCSIDNDRSQLLLAYEENDDETAMSYYEGRIHSMQELARELKAYEKQ